jgi:hypothetical protein
MTRSQTSRFIATESGQDDAGLPGTLDGSRSQPASSGSFRGAYLM